MEFATKANTKQEQPHGHYQKSAYENLIDINNNLSCMLKESFAEIDSICHRVRTCLLDANSYSKSSNLMVLDTTITTCQSVCLCKRLDAGNDYQHGDGSSEILTEIVEEKAPKDGVQGEIFEETSETEQDTITETSVESAEIDEMTSTNSQLPLPFITILNQNRSVQSVGVKVAPKNKLSTHCTTDNFQKIMEDVEKLSNYEQLLMSMVDDINKEINTSYDEHDKSKTQDKNQRKKSHRQNKEVVHKIKARKDATDQINKDVIVKITEDQLKKSPRDWIEDQFSDNDFHELYSFKGDKKGNSVIEKEMMNSTSPDVYRKRAITDLHQRLVAQVEANDSLIFFQKIMAKSRKRRETRELLTSSTDTVDNPERKALRSPIEHIIKRKNVESDKKQKSTMDIVQKYHDSLWFRQKKHEVRRRKKSHSNEKKRKTKRSNVKDEKTSSRKCSAVNSALSISTKGPSRKQSRISACNYKVQVTNEQPLSEPAKCKLNFMRTKYFQMTNRKLKHMDILDDITKNDVMPIKSEYPRRDQIRQITKTNIKNSYLYKLMYGTKSILENAWFQFFEPNIKRSKRNCSRRSRTRVSTVETESDEDDRGKHNTSRGQVIRKLSKYIFSETVARDNIYTVMPVHVFYDHYRPSLTKEETPQKLPLMPMKECKETAKKAEWKDSGRKAKPVKVVYDPIMRKIEREIKITTARPPNKLDKVGSGQTISWSPKNFSKYCTNPNSQLNPAPKKETQQKTSHRMKELNSSAPGGASKRSSKSFPSPAPTERLHPLVPPLWMNYHDALMKKSDTSTKSKASKQKEEQQRRIWEHKYTKSVGNKLINFIEKQPQVYKVPLPKYALPKPYSESRQKLMIKQLFDLKQKNDSIQTNIQKAIEVIEKKMIDIISKPATSDSMEAFDEMEKEITNVLNMMKCSQRKGTPTKQWGTLDRLEENNEEIDKISDELFKRLDKILDSSELSSTSNSSKKMSKKQNQLLNSDSSRCRSNEMKQICFSSTSASGEEKFVITAISPNKKPKKVSPTTIQSTSTPPDQRESEPLPEKLCASKPNDICDFLKLELTQKDQPLETIVNLALVEPMVPQNEIIKEHSSGSTKSSDNAEMSSQEDRFSHGDFDNNQSSNKEDINTDAAAIPMDEKEGLYSPIAERSNSSINVLSNNTDTIYFTPQSSPLRKLRSEEATVDALDEAREVDSGEPTKNVDIKKIHEIVEVKQIDEIPEDDDIEKRIETNKSEGLDVFYENVNRIIRRVEDVYSQLDEFELEILEEEVSRLNSETKLSPSNLKEDKNEDQPDVILSLLTLEPKEDTMQCVERVATPKSISTGRSPSYYNVLSFLDSLGDFQEDRPVEIHNYRICPTHFVVEMPLTFSFSALFNFATFQTVNDLPKKRSGCLKKSSLHSNISPTKSKQKVSFLLQKLHKETQVRSCPFHNAKWNQPEYHNKANISTVVRVDQEVTATLDVKVTRSVDRMSSADESYQSTLETSDELSAGMMSVEPETVLNRNLSETSDESKNNVVEIFRSNQKLESNGTNTVKVFYDDYRNRAKSDSKDIDGYFNETSIEGVKRSLSTTFEVKKHDSIEKLTKDISPDNFVSEIIKEVSLLEPLKNLNQFVDSALLKEVIGKRQKMRMLKRKNSCSLTAAKDPQDEGAKDAVVSTGEKEGFLKGIYVFVYILMFTALNLEFKCVQ
ncbi:uncharacterized protein LOC143193842 isoform X2 [Rhynchophorus ferrugineus]|uniref:uncharacterized protein LOC143193842 isoform X2 n=1 Tax=Rhynchophorus ferrugineus TaxID=354439 RepID=UPI003FCD72F6